MGKIYGLKEGFSWNPLLKLPANLKCPCESGLKFKKCCRKKMAEVIPSEVAAQYEEGMKNILSIRFVNDDGIPDGLVRKEIEELPGGSPFNEPVHAHG